MQLTDFLHENRHHLTVELSFNPEATALLEKLMATVSSAAQAIITAIEANTAQIATLVSESGSAAQESADLAAIGAAVAAQTAALAPPAASTLTISPATLTDPVLSTPYSAQLSASGGSEPYTFSLAVGSELPPGLSLSSSGEISGTPTTSGSYSFVVDCIDATTPTALDGSQSYSVTF
jgi:large repetitive protein